MTCGGVCVGLHWDGMGNTCRYAVVVVMVVVVMMMMMTRAGWCCAAYEKSLATLYSLSVPTLLVLYLRYCPYISPLLSLSISTLNIAV